MLPLHEKWKSVDLQLKCDKEPSHGTLYIIFLYIYLIVFEHYYFYFDANVMNNCNGKINIYNILYILIECTCKLLR